MFAELKHKMMMATLAPDLIDQGKVAVIICNADSEIIYISTQIEKLVGRPLAVLQGEALGRILKFMAGQKARLRLESGASFISECARVQKGSYQAIILKDVANAGSRDPVTGAMSKSEFLHEAQLESVRAQRYGRALAMAILKVEGVFENDDQRDETLRYFAENCLSGLRVNDLMARYSANQFIIMAPETNLAQAVQMANRIQARLNTNLDLATLDLKMVVCEFKKGEVSINLPIERLEKAFEKFNSDQNKSIVEAD